ncbi:MAG: zinc-ribbon domain-containing protein [Coriobacteriales bacterium]
MALVNCPKCGGEISDKAKTCVHCGAEVGGPTPQPPQDAAEEPAEASPKEPEPKKTCAECGAELESDASVCMNCGCPVESEVSADQPVKKEDEKKESFFKKHKVPVIIVGVLALVALVIILVLVGMGNAAAAKHQAYVDNLNKVYSEMLSGASESEKMGGEVHDIWYSAIWKDDETWDSSIEKYHSDDFNAALKKYFNDTETLKKEVSIASHTSAIDEAMKEMQDPPDDLKNACDAMNDAYKEYKTLSELATNPTGNLTTFTSQFNQADTNVASELSAFKNKIPSSDDSK